MSNSMQIFNFENTSDIRTFIYDEEPLFVAKDIATALGYLNTKSAIMLHCIDAITVQDFRMEILTKIRNSNNNNSSNTLLLELKDLHPQLKLIYDFW